MPCCKKVKLQREVSNPMGFENSQGGYQIRIFFGELLGSMILLTMGCMGSVDTLGEMFHPNNNEALTFGIAMMVSVRIFLHVSGGHVNPAITLLSVLVQMTPVIQLPVYLAGQISGAVLGCALFKAITPINHLGGGYRNGTAEKLLGACSPSMEKSTLWYQAIIFEFFASTVVCWSWCSIWDYRNIDRMETSVFRYGITYNALILCGTSVTKANMNPARSLAPAILNHDWSEQWIFWVGPLSGSVFSALVYRFFLYESPDSYSLRWD